MTKQYFQTEMSIRYRDTDSMGHVSSPVYYEYIQSAYLEYMHTLLGIPKDKKLPHIMVKTSCDYVSQAKYGDRLIVVSHIKKFGTKSFEMEHVMHLNDVGAAVVARGESVHVMFDYERQQTYPIPEEFRRGVLEFQEAL